MSYRTQVALEDPSGLHLHSGTCDAERHPWKREYERRLVFYWKD